MFRQLALEQLQKCRHDGPRPRALVGLDGFVDTIVRAVGTRHGPGANFSAIPTITEFGERVLRAAGKSTNLEFFPLQDKLGGNGPIMAQALAAGGTPVTYIGALGRPNLHPVFEELGRLAKVYSIAVPAHTTAVEFQDGKLMLGQMRSLDDITIAQMQRVVGEDQLRAEFSAAGLIALVNWTMIPNMTAIFRELTDRLLPSLPLAPREFFFDLADPEKRSAADLREALEAICRFTQFGPVILGLNLKEAQQVAAVLGTAMPGLDEASLRDAATELRAALGVTMLAVHPRDCAACATATATFWRPGPYTSEPLLTTGAGDHFNAGFCNGRLLGLDAEHCLALALATSGSYVRTGISPSLDELATFLANWC